MSRIRLPPELVVMKLGPAEEAAVVADAERMPEGFKDQAIRERDLEIARLEKLLEHTRGMSWLEWATAYDVEVSSAVRLQWGVAHGKPFAWRVTTYGDLHRADGRMIASVSEEDVSTARAADVWVRRKIGGS